MTKKKIKAKGRDQQNQELVLWKNKKDRQINMHITYDSDTPVLVTCPKIILHKPIKEQIQDSISQHYL